MERGGRGGGEAWVRREEGGGGLDWRGGRGAPRSNRRSENHPACFARTSGITAQRPPQGAADAAVLEGGDEEGAAPGEKF